MPRFIALTFLVLALSNAPAVAASDSARGVLVDACLAKAQSRYATAYRLEPSLRATITNQRQRMTAVCEKWRTASSEQSAALLAECISLAGEGPRHIQRGRNRDLAEISAQRKVCSLLAALN